MTETNTSNRRRSEESWNVSELIEKGEEKLKNVLTILRKGLLLIRLFDELIVIINILRSKVTNSEIDLHAF